MAIYRIADPGLRLPVVTPGGRQHCFYGSRRAPTERTEMQVGPFRIESSSR